jgi:hypothetical protein
MSIIEGEEKQSQMATELRILEDWTNDLVKATSDLEAALGEVCHPPGPEKDAADPASAPPSDLVPLAANLRKLSRKIKAQVTKLDSIRDRLEI